MTQPDQHILDEAIAWFVKFEREDTHESDWEDFIDWLERDPEHAIAYDTVVAGDAGLTALSSEDEQISFPEPNEPANDNRPKWYAGMAVAATALIAAFWLWPLSQSPDYRTFETRPGEVREVALGDETLITLNGNSKLRVDMAGQRLVRIDRGEALFVVAHDPSNPFTVEIGPERVVDVGTVFNIVRGGDEFSVAVAEGEVVFNPDAEAISIAPGQRIAGNIGGGPPVREEIEAAAIADWTHGELVFADTPLSEVAAEIERNIGEQVTVDPGIANLRFTGTLQLASGSQALFEGLAGLTGITANTTNDGWRLSR